MLGQFYITAVLGNPVQSAEEIDVSSRISEIVPYHAVKFRQTGAQKASDTHEQTCFTFDERIITLTSFDEIDLIHVRRPVNLGVGHISVDEHAKNAVCKQDQYGECGKVPLREEDDLETICKAVVPL